MYDQLEAKVNEITASGSLDSRRQVSYQTFLFTIMLVILMEMPIKQLILTMMLRSHRCTKIDPEVRLQKLHAFINPVQQAWKNPEMDQAIDSFSGFCDLLGLSKVRDYLVSRRVQEIQQWGLYQLDAEGQLIQKQLDERTKVY